MNTYTSYTRIFIVFIFTILSQNIGWSQCPPSAISTANSTIVIVDTGVTPVLPGVLPPFIEIFNYCNNVMNNSAASIEITIGGVTTVFADRTTGHNSSTNTCTVSYDNAAADPTITNPLEVVFSDNPAEACTYSESGVLPVEISKFQIGLKENKVLLEWETLEELNNDYFEILRSNDAKNWETIGLVSGAGTTSQSVRYSFADEKASFGKNYYVLVQTDYDGSIQFSELKVISLKGERGHVNLYPNPASQNLTVEVSEDSNFPLDVNIFDATGRLVAVHQLLDYNQTLNIEELDKGFYHLQVNSQNVSISERFVKQ